MKTPDEIKKGLEYCYSAKPCADCSYDKRDFPHCVRRLLGDALDGYKQLESRLAQVERERDAADAAEDETKTSARIQHLIGLLYAVSCCEGAQITINKKLCAWAAETAEALKDVETNRQDTERE